jgi:hypothetical protein
VGEGGGGRTWKTERKIIAQRIVIFARNRRTGGREGLPPREETFYLKKKKEKKKRKIKSCRFCLQGKSVNGAMLRAVL